MPPDQTRSSHVVIRPAIEAEAGICEEILRSLPEWFGIEETIVQYRQDIERMETWVAEERGRVVGFLTVRCHNEHSAEIQVMAVRREAHGLGVGRQLVEHVEQILLTRAAEFLQVKTLGPSRTDEHYERTRKFYLGLGFRPVEESKLWGEANPCLVMIKHIGCRRG
jgi:GNAT superfamily N-acetyltransferase